ncbi:MAG TPA: S41 family peptidase [Anaerolineae bacterium]
MNSGPPYQPTTNMSSSPIRKDVNVVFIAVGILTLLCLMMFCVGAVAATGAITTLLVRPRSAHVVSKATQLKAQAPLQVTRITTTPAVTLTPLPTVSTPTVVASATTTPTPEAARPLTVTQVSSVTQELTARQIRIFESLWEIVNTNYIYPDFHGLDWKALRLTTLAQIKQGIDDEQFYDLMRSAIDRLNDNHSSFLSPQEAVAEQKDYQGTGSYTGIGIISDFNLDKHYAYVLQVLQGSPAEAAGIRAHDHIVSINGQPSVLENGDTNMPLLHGPVGSAVTITVSAQNGYTRTLVINRAPLSMTTPVEFHVITGTKRIGYLMIPTFFEDNVGDEVQSALSAMMAKSRLDGLIIDLRINGGGAYPVLMRSLGFFTMGKVGSLTNREGAIRTMIVKPEAVGNSQTVPIMVLTGHSTASYAEVFAGILRAMGRARLVGQKTGGNIETLHAHDFEDGSLAWIAEETFKLPNGRNWEGEGLTPDIAVNKGWDEITEDDDPVLTTALKAFK